MGWGQLNILLRSLIIILCIGFVMPKSQRMARVLVIGVVVGLEFDAWDCTWLFWMNFRLSFQYACCA